MDNIKFIAVTKPCKTVTNDRSMVEGIHKPFISNRFSNNFAHYIAVDVVLRKIFESLLGFSNIRQVKPFRHAVVDELVRIDFAGIETEEEQSEAAVKRRGREAV